MTKMIPAVALIVSGCASTNGGVAILSPGGQTIAGPGKFEVLSSDSITLASFLFQSRERIGHLCVTVINTGDSNLKTLDFSPFSAQSPARKRLSSVRLVL